MTAKNRIPQHVIDRLKKIRQTATMNNASFGFPHDTVTHTHHFEDTKTEHPDDYIKEKTRLWRLSWIIEPLDEVIAWAEGAANDA